MWYRWVWARNQATWRLLEGLSPTPGHLALARLEEAGLLSGVATQNVDRLHSRADQATVWELHGAYDHGVPDLRGAVGLSPGCRPPFNGTPACLRDDPVVYLLPFPVEPLRRNLAVT